ncbi:MAG: hypothetical protein EBR47_13810 [Betaproteobacteria bacterium]|nr:hypothetical protein [Betaproteobacteria bacterium]
MVLVVQQGFFLDLTDLMGGTLHFLLPEIHIICYQKVVVEVKRKALHQDHQWLPVDLAAVASHIELDHQTLLNHHKTHTIQIF